MCVCACVCVYHGCVCNLGFHSFCIRQSEGLKKTVYIVIFCSNLGVTFVYLCLRLCAIECFYASECVVGCTYTYAYVLE